MFAAHTALLTPAVTILAMVFYMYTITRVGAMRGKHKIDAPTMTGNPEFERACRVQANTLESLPVFLVGLWLATILFSPAVPSVAWLPAALGLLWIVGRIIYMQGYMAAPEKRSTGFLIGALAQITLLVLALAGIVMAWMATAPSTST
jgi:glutathione S-transferase